MKFLFLALIFFTAQNCSKPKTVLICGDHVCVNNLEAEQYFEQNLTIQVKIIDKKKEKKRNSLVELNLKNNSGEDRQVSIKPKSEANNNIKVLNNDEIEKIKKEIKEKKENTKIVKKLIIKDEKKRKNLIKKDDKIIKKEITKKSKSRAKVNKSISNEVDVCTIIEKCSIEEISKYILQQDKEKSFPDITKKQ